MSQAKLPNQSRNQSDHQRCTYDKRLQGAQWKNPTLSKCWALFCIQPRWWRSRPGFKIAHIEQFALLLKRSTCNGGFCKTLIYYCTQRTDCRVKLCNTPMSKIKVYLLIVSIAIHIFSMDCRIFEVEIKGDPLCTQIWSYIEDPNINGTCISQVTDIKKHYSVVWT